jgi:hypothetical protein
LPAPAVEKTPHVPSDTSLLEADAWAIMRPNTSPNSESASVIIDDLELALGDNSAASRGEPRVPFAQPAPVGSPELPLLEADGVTLRFQSITQYKTQHRANIAHGGIIVRSGPIPIGTQKFIGIQIPGKDRYTVSARVTFIGDGTVGFVIDSFPIHRAQLKAFAD